MHSCHSVLLKSLDKLHAAAVHDGNLAATDFDHSIPNVAHVHRSQQVFDSCNTGVGDGGVSQRGAEICGLDAVPQSRDTATSVVEQFKVNAAPERC